MIYGGEVGSDDLLMRVVLFRLFSKIETWRALESELGALTLGTLRGFRLARTLERLQAAGPIYTSACMLCANKAFGFDRKYLNHLELVRTMFRRRALPQAIARARLPTSMQRCCATRCSGGSWPTSWRSTSTTRH